MLPFMGNMAEPALPDLPFDLRGWNFRVDRDDPHAEFLIVMGLRRLMTLVTIAPLFGRMMKSGDRPFVDAVTIPAIFTK